jgi:hypothetical protein
MATGVTLRTPSSITIATNDRRIATASNTTPLTLRSQARTISKLADISDVDEALLEDGSSLVYDAATDTYIVKKLTEGEVTINTLNGGTF